MKLYYTPGACSLSPHIALLEAGLPYELVKVDIRAKKLENGEDYLKVNPKGQVPALGLDSGEIVTEGPVIVQMIADQASAMLELSTPVIRLWEGVIAVPLVGTLDSARTQLVMEKLLETLVATGADHAVLDITGVATVDTEVAQHLLKTVSAARLLGAECIVCGIRPQVAQTIVSLGIEFGDIATKATLADALAYALDRSGRRIDEPRVDPQ